MAARPTSVAITRQYTYPAAHTLRSDRLSETENRRVFGKCANPAGHGHNYGIQVTVACQARDTAFSQSGVVFPRGRLDELVAERIAPKFAYRDLNQSFDFITTGENLAVAVWDLLADAIGMNRRLTVRVIETPKNAFTYSGPNTQ